MTKLTRYITRCVLKRRTQSLSRCTCRRRLFEQFEPRLLLTAMARDGIPYVDLGTSDNVAWDQPRVAVELIEDDGTTQTSIGPNLFNTMLLDTGANSILAFATAVADMNGYQTEGTFEESGVAGANIFDISVPYRFDFAGTNGERNTLSGTRILSDANNDLSMFGPWGIVGMPAMVDRVTKLDFTVWKNVVDLELFMRVQFRNDLDAAPDPQRRYTVNVDNRVSFDPEPYVLSGNNPPVWADIPFLSAYPMHDGQAQLGNFLFDTGAQLSVMAKSMGIGIGLDSNGDGELDDKDANFARYETVGGIGGTISAPVFLFDEVHVPTAEGVDLVWTDLQWLVLDILPGLDGVLGSDLLTSGWIEAFGVDGKSGWIDQVQFDFREMSTIGPTGSNPNCAALLSCGKIDYDLNEQIPKPINPNGPGAKILEYGASTTVSEIGVEDAYQVLLTQQPAADVTITISSPEGQLTAVNAAQPTSQALVFTPSNWDIPQTVRVAAVNDSLVESFHRSSIFHTSSSSDPNYQDVGMPRVIVNIIDDDYAGVMIIPTAGSTDVTEGGASDTYDIVLTKAPSQDVTIQLEYASGQVVAVDDSNPSTSTLLFTPSNWNTPQTVRVTAVDDTQLEGSHKSYITHQLTSADAEYQEVFALQERVSITDNEHSLAITATDASQAEGDSGDTAFTFTVAHLGDASLTTTVNYAVTGSGANPADASDFGGAFPSGTISFASGDTSKVVTIHVSGDTVIEQAEGFTVTLSNATGKATIITAAASGTIQNDDAPKVSTWDGGGATDNWSDAANWSTDAVPQAGDSLTFDGTSNKNSIVDGAFAGTIGRLTVRSGYTGTITLARSLIAGSIDGSLGNVVLANNTLTTGSDNAHTRFSGAISGAGGVSKIGTGSFYMQASSTYDGATSISDGSILVSANNALGTAIGGTTVAAGANARLVFERSVNYTTREPVTINGSGMNGVGSLAGVGNSTFEGPITLGSASTIGAYPAGYTFTLNGDIDTSGNALTVRGTGSMILGGAVYGIGSLTKADSNTVSMSATNTYTGTTVVNAGTLLVNGSTANSTTTVNASGTLGGTGTVGPLTVSGGIVNPGSGVGPPLSGSTADFSSGGILRLQIPGFGTAGESFDQLNLSGVLTLGGTAQLSLDLAGLTGPGGMAAGAVRYGGRSGTFLPTIELLNNPNNYRACLTYNPTTLDIRIALPDGACGAWTTSNDEVGAVGTLEFRGGASAARPVAVASLDSGVDYTHPDLYRNVWLNQREIPAKIRTRLRDADRDGRITLRDLNHASNQRRGPIIRDLNRTGFIDGGDLLLAWSDGRDDDNNGYVDDLIGWDFVNNDNNPFDDSGHGTHGAGVLVQIAPNAEVLPLKFLDASLVGSLANASRALDYALTQQVTISSNGWVPSEFSQDWLDKLTRAADAGHLFITAAGNGDPAVLETLRRMKSSQILVVAAEDASGNLASFSNWDAEVVDLSAPGVGVISAMPGGGSAPASGTSVSTAFAAGVAALIQGSRNGLSRAALVDVILGDEANDWTGEGGPLDENPVLAFAADLYYQQWNRDASEPNKSLLARFLRIKRKPPG